MNAFHYWWLQSLGNDNGGLVQYNGTVSKRLYVLGNWSRFIRPGFYRMGATALPSAGVSVSAYKNSADSSPTTAVIVAINGNGFAVDQTFSFNGVTADSVVPWVTDPNHNLALQPAVAVTGGSFAYSLPVSSVVSFVGAVYVPPTPTPTASPTPTPTFTPCMVDGTPCTSTPTSTVTDTPTVTPTPVPPGPITARPNLLARGQTKTTFMVPEDGATLTVFIYTMAGELAAKRLGIPGSSQCLWDSAGTASGFYLAVVEVAEGNQSRKKVLKIAVIH
jgi:hypothetical protein